MRINIVEENYNGESIQTDRKLIISSSAFGILRQQLVRNIGIDRIKGFLFHYGWEMGVNDAKEAMQKDLSLESLIKYGPILHIKNGHIRGIKHNCTVEMGNNQQIQSYYSKGVWIDSYEAEEHIHRLGLSETPVCHTLIGYASGFMTTVTGEQLLAKEITCVGKGDPECSWILRTRKEWAEELQDEHDFYNETPILKELEYTYDQLLEQKQIITRLANFQHHLMEQISNGSKIQTITDLVFGIVKVPVIVEGIDQQTIAYSGFTEECYLEIKNDIEHFYKNGETGNWYKINENDQLPFRKKVIKTSLQERLIIPIVLQKKVLGYCSLIYKNIKRDQHEEDFLILERFANAVSLMLLNEKTVFESYERMKGNFLEQIIDRKYSENEIVKRGKYTGLDLRKSYYITVMEYQKNNLTLEEEFLFQEQIFETTFHYFNKTKQNILIGHRDGHMVLFIPEESIKNDTIYYVIENFHDYMLNIHPYGKFKFGISNLGSDIKKANAHYDEAMNALKLTIKKDIMLFKTLGIIGLLINTKNVNGIKMVAENELGPLYNMNDTKMVELLKTLYIFLINGGKLEQTMSDLALSMSGLRHRITKIEDLLKKDLRDPNETHQLLLILKSLIVLGEFEIE